jgi:C1A family cysteine protease
MTTSNNWLSWEFPKKESDKIVFGWIPDLPDFRDFSFSKVVTTYKAPKTLPNKSELDLTKFSKVEDQKNLGSCTANAAAGIIEYMERMAKGNHIDVSRLFVYKVTRKLMNEVGDTGAYLRDTLKAMRLFGALPEEYWPYVTSTFDAEPTAYQYAIAGNYKSLSYFRVDQQGMTAEDILLSIKQRIQKRLPLMFGFTCFSSLNSVKADGIIPFPTAGENMIGGHAVLLVGYDDDKKLFKIRNSWGESWGEKGYGYLPYDYLLQGLMVDIWGVSKQDWVDTGVFN